MHWFEGEDELEEVASRGYYVSIGPAVLYSRKLRRIAARMPFDKLLTESDGPIAFKAIEGGSGPGLMPSVLFAIAEVKGISFLDASETVDANLRRYLEPR